MVDYSEIMRPLVGVNENIEIGPCWTCHYASPYPNDTDGRPRVKCDNKKATAYGRVIRGWDQVRIEGCYKVDEFKILKYGMADDMKKASYIKIKPMGKEVQEKEVQGSNKKAKGKKRQEPIEPGVMLMFLGYKKALELLAYLHDVDVRDSDKARAGHHTFTTIGQRLVLNDYLLNRLLKKGIEAGLVQHIESNPGAWYNPKIYKLTRAGEVLASELPKIHQKLKHIQETGS